MLDLYISALNNLFEKEYDSEYVAKDYICFAEINTIGVYYFYDYYEPILLIKPGIFESDGISIMSFKYVDSIFIKDIENVMLGVIKNE